MSGKPFRGFESHPLRQNDCGIRISECGRRDCRFRNADLKKTRVNSWADLESAFRIPQSPIERVMVSLSFLIRGIVLAIAVACVVTLCAPGLLGQTRPRGKRASICGNPRLACKTSVPFEPHHLPFRVPKNAVIYDTEPFYAIVLQSVSANYDNCELFVSEKERLAAQALFPDHKVFTSRCMEPGDLFYTNVSENHRIMAVYAGGTLADAKRVLPKIKATGRFPGAYVRRMRTGFNGT